LVKQNYRQQKKQKEAARKSRQAEKQQRRQTRPNAPETVGDSEPSVAVTPNDAIAGDLVKN
jgi:hypothetical protein